MTLEESEKLPIGALLTDGRDYFLVSKHFIMSGYKHPLVEGIPLDKGDSVIHIAWDSCKRIA